MDHFQAFQARPIRSLPLAGQRGWRLKRYAVLSEGRSVDDDVVSAATAEACLRLPPAGALEDESSNHGVGFQIIHFAQVAVVSPVFYWQWGSVLGSIDQMRAQWQAPCTFQDGVAEVVGCIWEMEIVAFEVAAWKSAMLTGQGRPEDRLDAYLGACLV